MTAERRRRFLPLPMALAALATVFAASGSALAAPMRGAGQNIVTLTFGESYLVAKNGNYFSCELSVQLGDYPVDPSTATVRVAVGGMGGAVYPLDWDPVDQAFRLIGKFADVEDLRASLHGSFVIEIIGASSSTSTFSFNALGLAANDIYSQARNLSPARNSVVQGNEPCTWDPPLTGPATPFRLGCRRDGIYSGGLPAGTTSWNPGVCMEPGVHDLAVEYVGLTPVSLYTPMTVVSGSIVWSNYSFMPAGSYSTGPALGTVSLALSQGIFSTGEACSILGDVNGDGVVNGADLGLLLGNWGSPGATDLNGDGTTNGVDLGLLLGNWS